MPDDFRAATPRVASGVLFRDAAGRVLLVKPTYKDGWDIPGGYVEPGESPKQAARREVQEELGVTPAIGRLAVVDWAPHPKEGDKLLFIFDGGVIASTELDGVELQREEIDRVEFVDVDDLAGRMPARLADRVRSACFAKDGDSYLEHGHVVTD